MKPYRSEDVSATCISRSVNKQLTADTTWRDAISVASELGISPHTNKWGTTCYTAYQANKIRDIMCRRILDERAKIKAAEERKAASDNAALAAFSDADLANELRSRGWELVAERKKTIIESL